MAQTHEGAIKTAAQQIGITEEEFRKKSDAGLKHCRLCREWHPLDEFGSDKSRSDGKASACRKSRGVDQRSRYVKRGRVSKLGARFKLVRDGDQRQAYGRIHHLIRTGRLPHPNELPCTDCGHIWKEGERRHEYDHYLGYAAEHHESVEAVCTLCHHARERGRDQIIMLLTMCLLCNPQSKKGE